MDPIRDCSLDVRTRCSHGEFNPFNILQAKREPWQAVDPKPLGGDPPTTSPSSAPTATVTQPPAPTWAVLCRRHRFAYALSLDRSVPHRGRGHLGSRSGGAGRCSCLNSSRRSRATSVESLHHVAVQEELGGEPVRPRNCVPRYLRLVSPKPGTGPQPRPAKVAPNDAGDRLIIPTRPLPGVHWWWPTGLYQLIPGWSRARVLRWLRSRDSRRASRSRVGRRSRTV